VVKKAMLVVGLLAAVLVWGCGGKQEVKVKDEHAGHDHGPGEHGVKQEQTAKAAADTTYPLDVCVVSGQKLGSMGDPVVIKHEGRTVKFCCAGCKAAFEKEPAKYLAKLDEAIKEKATPAP
jgi:YHS domain-containing protein